MSRILTDDEAIATAALAGWRFVRSQSTTYPKIVVWDTYDKNGRYYGLDSVLANAARYALAQMESEDDSRDGRCNQRMRHDPVADPARMRS